MMVMAAVCRSRLRRSSIDLRRVRSLPPAARSVAQFDWPIAVLLTIIFLSTMTTMVVYVRKVTRPKFKFPKGAMRAPETVRSWKRECNGLDWTGLGWNGMEWNGMGWDGVEWDCDATPPLPPVLPSRASTTLVPCDVL
jgi:hypothetical protein